MIKMIYIIYWRFHYVRLRRIFFIPQMYIGLYIVYWITYKLLYKILIIKAMKAYFNNPPKKT